MFYNVCVCVCVYIYIYIYIHTHTYIYRVSQKECAKLREGVPYVKVYRYNPKHLCPKLNGYGDNGQRKVWSSGGSTHCICQLRVLSMSVLSVVSYDGHVTSVLGIHVSCIVLGTLRTTTTVRVFL